jgi:hypothetical protein
MIELPDTNYASKIADWIELYVLYEERAISKNRIVSIIESHSGEVDEAKVDGAIQELVRRLSLYGDTKPYSINKNIITPKFNWRKYPELTLCLLFSTHGAANAKNGTKLFEQLTKSCIDYFLSCKSINFGFPAGVSFKNQLNSLAASCNEERRDNPSPADKDRGIDIVAWKTFNDSRNSNIYLLLQCAAGANWSDKSVLPYVASWRRYINWNSSTTVPAISITQIIETDDWTNAVDQLGFIIDRARLFRTITTKGYKTNPKLKKEITDWCKRKLN